MKVQIQCGKCGYIFSRNISDKRLAVPEDAMQQARDNKDSGFEYVYEIDFPTICPNCSHRSKRLQITRCLENGEITAITL